MKSDGRVDERVDAIHTLLIAFLNHLHSPELLLSRPSIYYSCSHFILISHDVGS